MINIIAIDLGKFNSMFCFHNSENQEFSTTTGLTDRGYFESVIRSRVNKCKNSIRSIFANQGIRISSGARTRHTGRQQLIEASKPLVDCDQDELWRGELDLELTQLAAVEKHLKVVDKRLDAIAKEDPRIQRVMQINGVGLAVAAAARKNELARSPRLAVACVAGYSDWRPNMSSGSIQP